jgi:hypothetical protein
MTTPTPPTRWRKSSYSISQANCVELAATPDAVLLRDSKHPDAGHLILTRAQLAALLTDIKAGTLDHYA